MSVWVSAVVCGESAVLEVEGIAGVVRVSWGVVVVVVEGVVVRVGCAVVVVRGVAGVVREPSVLVPGKGSKVC